MQTTQHHWKVGQTMCAFCFQKLTKNDLKKRMLTPESHHLGCNFFPVELEYSRKFDPQKWTGFCEERGNHSKDKVIHYRLLQPPLSVIYANSIWLEFLALRESCYSRKMCWKRQNLTEASQKGRWRHRRPSCGSKGRITSHQALSTSSVAGNLHFQPVNMSNGANIILKNWFIQEESEKENIVADIAVLLLISFWIHRWKHEDTRSVEIAGCCVPVSHKEPEIACVHFGVLFCTRPKFPHFRKKAQNLLLE